MYGSKPGLGMTKEVRKQEQTRPTIILFDNYGQIAGGMSCMLANQIVA